MPEWLAELSNFRVIAGQAAYLPFGENVNMFGESTQVTVDLGMLKRFAGYDTISNTLVIYEDLSSEIDVGSWPVKITSEYVDSIG